MKRFRIIVAVTMTLALLGLVVHQHDSDESRDNCPAAAWHSGAVNCANPQVALPSQPEQFIEFVPPSTAPILAQVPALFRPRGPPSTLS